MKPRHRAVVVIAALSGAALWLLNRPAEMPAAKPDPLPATEPPALSQPAPAASSSAASTTPTPAAANPPETAISSAQAPASPASSTATRAAAVPLAENPLIAADVPAAPPPRRVSHVDPELALVFDQIMLMFRDYRTLTGENPVGTNEEMMKAIMGGNPKGAMLGPPEGQSVNENGELIDRWGSPYFFHQLAKDRLEIRSAGPDRRLWNEDDLISD